MNAKYPRLLNQAFLWGLLLIFTLPFALVVYQLIAEIDVGINFAKKEQLGLQYNAPLRRLLEHIIQHKNQANDYLTGNSKAQKKLILKQSQIQKDIKTLDIVDLQLNKTLQTTPKWNYLKSKLQQLTSKVFTLTPQQSFEAHNAVIAEILNTIAHAGDTSNLILDPELDSYYLMDTVVNNLPSLVENTALARELGLDIIEKNQITTEQNLLLIGFINSLEKRSEKINRGMKIAFNKNFELKTKLETYTWESLTTTNTFTSLISENLINSDNINSAEAVDYFASATEALDSQFRFYDVVSPALNELLQNRINSNNRKKYFVQIFALIVIVTAVYAFIAFSRNLKKQQKAEIALQQAEAKYRSIFENSTEGLFQTTPEGRYLSANPALARIYGYSSAEELMDKVRDLENQLYVNSEVREEFKRLMLKHDAVSQFEFQVYRQDRNVIWISEKARTVRDKTGKILYYEGSIEDITARKMAEESLRYQQNQTEKLLLNILPQPIVQRLKEESGSIADHFEEVSVLFADLVGFTQISEKVSPQELVDLLNQIFSAFDHLAQKHGLEKIKTIGDAYMVVGGLPVPRTDHAEAIAQMALDMLAEMKNFSKTTGQPFRIRIGINSGPVVAGVIGIKKFIYDLWGDTVNIASRMESHGLADSIQVTETTYHLLQQKYTFEARGAVEIKGKGKMLTYLLLG